MRKTSLREPNIVLTQFMTRKSSLNNMEECAAAALATMGIGQERAIKEKAAQNKIASDPEPALEETALPLPTSQNGRL